MKQYYVLTNRGKTFLDETWEHLKDKGMYNVMDAMDDERYRFLHEIFRVLGGDRSGDIIIYDEEDNCLDDDALNFCKVRNLMRPIGVDKIEGMLIDRAKKIKGVWSNIMMLYIKMAYGHSSVDEDNILYDFLESKMKELKEYGGSLDEENQEIYRRFMALKKYNIKFAGEFVINRVHHFLCDSGDLCDVLFPDGDIGEVQEILGVMHENNAEGNGFYGKGEEHYFYERNSEHKRKVKSTKKEKQKTVIKRHIFRKNVSG
jgi:hypothetical protein